MMTLNITLAISATSHINPQIQKLKHEETIVLKFNKKITPKIIETSIKEAKEKMKNKFDKKIWQNISVKLVKTTTK